MKRSIFVITVVAVLALAGGAFAASQITGKQIKNSTITSKDVKNKSLTKSDFKGSVRGARGPAGPAGSEGPAGSVAGVTVAEAQMTVQPGEVNGPQAFCPAGSSPVGTGFFASIADVGFVKVFGNSVGAGYANNSSIPVDTSVQAICGAGVSATGTVARSKRASQRAFTDALAQLKAQR